MFRTMGFYFKQPHNTLDDEQSFDLMQQLLNMLHADTNVPADQFDWGDIDHKLTDEQLDQIMQQLRDTLDAES